MKFKIKTSKLIKFILISLLIVVIIWLLPKINKVFSSDPYSTEYMGEIFTFREKVKDAYFVKIYNEKEITQLLIRFPYLYVNNRKLPRQVNIVIPNVSNEYTALYVVEAYELGFKLRRFYNLINKSVVFKGATINSKEELKNFMGTTIYIQGPDMSNHTDIFAAQDVIYIRGNNKKNLDLAVMRLILFAFDKTKELS